MLLTLKRKHGLIITENENIDLYNFLKQGNNIKRCAVNYFKKTNCKNSDCEVYIKTLNNLDLMNASWIKAIVNNSKNIIDRDNNLFGSRHLFNKLKNKDYKNEEERLDIQHKYRMSRNTQLITMRGSTNDPNGNRNAKLNMVGDILNIVFKINKNIKYNINLYNIEHKQLVDIKLLVNLLEQKKAYFNIGIDRENIYISYDNSILMDKKDDLIKNRTIGIDLNPTELGIVIMDNGEVINEIIYDINELYQYRNAKKSDYEFSIIGEMIVKMALHYKCESIVLEKLKLKNSNVKIFNEWNVKDIKLSINKYCDFYGIKYKEVIAYYSSFMGSFLNPDKIDCIASAIELCKRGYLEKTELIKKRIEKFLSKKIYLNQLPNHWKKQLIGTKIYKNLSFFSLRDLYSLFKSNSNYYYRVRVRFNQVKINLIGYSLKSNKSKIKVYNTLNI